MLCDKWNEKDTENVMETQAGAHSDSIGVLEGILEEEALALQE